MRCPSSGPSFSAICIPCNSLFFFEKSYVASCSVSLSVGNILIAYAYRSPSSSALSDIELSTFINHLCSMDHKYKLIVGDFNMPDVNWEPESVSLSSTLVTVSVSVLMIIF